MARKIRIIVDDREWDAEVAGNRVLVGDGAIVVVLDEGDGRYLAEHDGVALQTVAAADGEAVWVGADGFLFEIQVRPAGEPAASASGDQDLLSPPMAATVVRLAVQPGARVQRGDTLVVVEAMKMELPIRAPRDGVVLSIQCREGQLVQPGVALVELGDVTDTGSR